jgi:hypothetical protein
VLRNVLRVIVICIEWKRKIPGLASGNPKAKWVVSLLASVKGNKLLPVTQFPPFQLRPLIFVSQKIMGIGPPHITARDLCMPTQSKSS